MERGEGAEGNPGISSSGLLPHRDAGKLILASCRGSVRVSACLCVRVSACRGW